MKYWVSNKSKGTFIEVQDIFLWKNNYICKCLGDGTETVTSTNPNLSIEAMKVVKFRVLEYIKLEKDGPLLDIEYNMVERNYRSYYTKGFEGVTEENYKTKLSAYFI